MLAALQRKMIAWTSVLVVAVGAFILTFMLQPPPGVRAIGAQRAARVTGSARHPASAIESNHALSSEAPAVEEESLDVALDCNPTKKLDLGPATLQVRLLGRPCARTGEIATSEVRNDANGFSGTVFIMANGKSFTTDYISLAFGENKIRLLHIFKNGLREEREQLIERRHEPAP